MGIRKHKSRELNPVPLHIVDTADSGVSKIVESARREVEIRDGTGFTPVGHHYGSALAII